MELARDRIPIGDDALEQYRLGCKHRMPSSGLGAHLRRRLGHSLEFKDYGVYVPGDDVRAVDWRASQRIGGFGDWVTRRFEAEERLTLAIAVDTRPTMYLPEDPAGSTRSGAEKILVAGWIARALAKIATHEKDNVLFHQLYVPVGTGDLAPITAGSEDARDFADHLLEGVPRNDSAWHQPFELNEESLLAALPPASVLVVISDLYFDGNDGRFSEMLIKAQSDYRQVVLVRLDSWPTERAILARGTSRIHSIESVPLDEGLVDVNDSYLNEVAERIELHVRQLLEDVQAGGLVIGTWPWPETAERLGVAVWETFEKNFLAFDGFHSIFAKSS